MSYDFCGWSMRKNWEERRKGRARARSCRKTRRDLFVVTTDVVDRKHRMYRRIRWTVQGECRRWSYLVIVDAADDSRQRIEPRASSKNTKIAANSVGGHSFVRAIISGCVRILSCVHSRLTYLSRLSATWETWLHVYISHLGAVVTILRLILLTYLCFPVYCMRSFRRFESKETRVKAAHICNL